MRKRPDVSRHAVLRSQLQWFVRLRWLAGVGVVVSAGVDGVWLGWYGQPWHMLSVGVAILLYNVGLWLWIRPAGGSPPNRKALLLLAGLQILLDLGCLALLTTWTGGAQSPLLGFFVFHMVFASLLLPPMMAYAGAAVAWGMLVVGLLLSGAWPPEWGGVAALAGWTVMLLLTVFLANHLARHLREHERRLAEQGERISTMSDEIDRQRRAMVQQEKMVALGQLAAGVAHEIANPLACMDSVLQLIQRHPDRACGESVGQLREQIVRINRIVQQLTRFSYPQETRWQVLPVSDLVRRALQLVRLDSRVTAIHVDREIAPDSGSARLQVHAIEQVLVNLMLNAVDALAEVEDPRLTIRTGARDAQCFVEIADNGHGIPEEHLDRIFEPFFTTKPVGKGTGLGLAISYTTVQNHGGSIEVRSGNGQGAAFTVWLPRAEDLSELGQIEGVDSQI